MIKLRVEAFGAPLHLEWHDGIVTGDVQAVKFVVRMADVSMIAVPGMPTFQGTDILEHAGAFYMLCTQLFDEVEVTEGELPDWSDEDLPEGAIA